MRQISDITGFQEHLVKGASTAFAILFIISGVLHIWQSFKYNSWFYTWLLPCACVIFTASFICREWTAFNPTSDGAYSPFQGLFYSGVFIITVPLYSFLPRLLATYDSFAPIRPAYVCPIIGFFFSALISIIALGATSFFSSNSTDSTVSSGLALLKASLVIQLFLNVAFISVIAIFHRQCSSKGIFQQSRERWMKLVIISLYISVALILVRNLFSTVQIFLPSHSPAWTIEAYFWVFDATPMLVYTMFLHIMHPAKYFQTQGSHFACSARGPADVEEGKRGPGQSKE